MNVLMKAATNIGKVRKVNEDSYFVSERTNSAFICDGMGGHVAGATASKVARETIIRVNSLLDPIILNEFKPADLEVLSKNFYHLNAQLDSSLPEVAINLINAIQLANLRIFNTAQTYSNLKGMGTTTVGFSFVGNLCCIAHVGDSRAYRIRQGKIVPQTVDHSWLNELIKAGKLLPEEADKFPHRNVITRALGVAAAIQVDIRIDPVQADDFFIISSDGLHDLMSDETILHTILESPDNLEQGVQRLIQVANDLGGRDNITVVIAKVLEVAGLATHYHYQATIPEEARAQNEVEIKILKQLFGAEFDDTATIGA